MARPLRIEYAGAVYHITSRGDRRELFDARAWAYCTAASKYAEFVAQGADVNLWDDQLTKPNVIRVAVASTTIAP
ncbi:MAG: hypothetical protein H0T87_06330 [Gammaproteobacteria bacterium]|nr:hypothetical protein [Gammaproteobacteria bacterium]